MVDVVMQATFLCGLPKAIGLIFGFNDVSHSWLQFYSILRINKNFLLYTDWV
jgi:hypothetical protein